MNFKKISLFVFSMLTIISAKSFADDIDIYTGKTGKSESNILFMIDVSGSMSSDSPTRISQVKSGLENTLNSLSDDIKVGVGIYNGNGASIISPIERLGNMAVGKYTSYIDSSGNDAYENKDGNIIKDSNKLPFSGNNAKKIEISVSSSSDDASQCLDETSFYYLNQAYLEINKNTSCYYNQYNAIGTIFRNIPLDKYTQITNAYIEYTANGDSISQRSDIEIFIENSTSPNTYSDKKKRRIIDRTLYNFGYTENIGKITWSPLIGDYDDNKIVTPNIAPLVQSILNSSSWKKSNNGINIITKGVLYQRLGNINVDSYDTNPLTAAKLVIEYNEDNSGVSAAEFDNSTSTNELNKIGLIYNNVTVPSYVNISKGFIEITASENTLNGGSLTLSMVNYNDTQKSITSSINDLTNKDVLITKTFNMNSWVKGEKYKLDISDLLNSYFANDNWCGGENLMFLLSSNTLSSIYSYDYGQEYSPRLSIEYDGSQDSSCSIITKSYSISDKNNDGYNYYGTEYINRDYLLSGTNIINAMRFTGINLEKDDEIVSSYLELTPYANSSTAVGFNIYGDISNNNNPLDYLSTKISLRTNLTSSNVRNDFPSLIKLSTYETVDISSILNEIKSRNDWVNGNSISFIFKGNSNSYGYFFSYDYNQSYSPILNIKMKKRGASAVANVRTSLISTINALQVNGGTPILGSTIEAYNYFTGGNVLGGVQRSDNYKFVSSPKSWINGNWIVPSGCDVDNNYSSSYCKSEKISGTPTYISPMSENACETNNLIMITDGYPTEQDNSYFPNGESVFTKVKNITGKTCYNTWDCIYTITAHMAENDLSKGTDGVQNIYTDVIGFGSFDSKDELETYASKGMGNFYNVNDTSALSDALGIIVDSILDIETTIATPGVAVNQNNKFQYLNELYYSVFKPSKLMSWDGNIKKYKIKAVNSDGTDFDIIDQNGINAVNDNTGFFKDESQSFWSTYVDGKSVTDGGAAEQINAGRNIFTYTDINGSMNDKSLNVSKYKLNTSNTVIQKSDFNITESWTSQNYIDFLKWIDGYDMNDDDEDGITNESRKKMSDPLHSQPTVVNYNDTDSTIFVSTNEGFLQGIDTDSGEELFAFIPKSLLPNQYKRYRNKVSSHMYGLDSSWIAYRHDHDNNGEIGNNVDDFVYLYGGMRRGGSEYFVLDVTNIKASNTKTSRYPKIKFIISPEKSGFEKLGQTWSVPVLAKVRFNNEEKIIMIVGGGYDVTNDTSGTVITYNGIGNAIYVIDAQNGDLLWSMSNDSANLINADMKFSITGKISVLDLDNDGFMDYMYASDLGGQIFKIKINQENKGASTFASAITFAKLGITDDTRAKTVQNNRKFYEKPTIVPVLNSNNGEKYLDVIVTSGFRANPLDENIQDAIFVIKDKDVVNNELGDKTYVINDLYDATFDIDENSAINKINEKNGYLIWFKEGSANSNSFSGEKGMGEITAFNNVIYFSTYFPSVEAKSCSPVAGSSRNYEINILDGRPNPSGTTQNDKDSTPNELRSKELGLAGLSSGTKIIYTNDGIVSLTNTDATGLGMVSGLGIFKSTWYPKKEKESDKDSLIPPHLR